MLKKLGLLLGATVVLAFAIPAVAGAHAVTSKAGVLAPKGTVITATGSDVTFTSSILGATTCTTLTLTFELTENDGTDVTGSGTTNNPPSSGCVQNGNPVTITSFAITRLAAEGTETNMNFTM